MINGNARNDGVFFGSDNYSVHFSMEKDLSYKVHVLKNISKKVKTIGVFKSFLYKIPFIRGVVVQFEQNKAYSIMFLAIFILDIINIFGKEESFENNDTLFYGILIILVPMILYSLIYLFKKVLFKLKNTLQFHGAEHKVINAYKKHRNLNFEDVKNASRISRWCGTELSVFFIIFFAAFSLFLKYDSIKFLISFSFAYEIFNLKNGEKLPILSILFKFGYYCQEKLFTKEPTDEQLKASIDAFKMLLEAERKDKIA